MKALYLNPQKLTNQGESLRNSIGGNPIIPKSYQWPICPKSGKKMVLFLQFDVPDEIEKYKGYHITIFMSPEINEIPSFNFISDGEFLSEEFWKEREDHFKIWFFKGNELIINESDSYLECQEIEFQVNGDDEMIRFGGLPDWIQDPEVPVGPNGESFDFFLQIPENFPFMKQKKAPEQPDSFSNNDYCLFLGNQIYFFVSKEVSNHEGVWVTVQ